MIKRRVFYSFHYAADSWRAATVRNIGAVEGNRPATDNKWEEVTKGGEAAIKRWIAGEMKYRSCTVVLAGSQTAGRHWIDYEIQRAWSEGMGLAGIHIHGLRDQYGYKSIKGQNPFAHFTFPGQSGYPISFASVVKCYDIPGINSQERYSWIRDNFANIVEEAIRIRSSYR